MSMNVDIDCNRNPQAINDAVIYVIRTTDAMLWLITIDFFTNKKFWKYKGQLCQYLNFGSEAFRLALHL